MALTIKIIPNDKGTPPGKLADVELHFTMNYGEVGRANLADVDTIHYTIPEAQELQDAARMALALDGLKLIGFAIWERKTGLGRNVTFPARQYSVNGERRSMALLRPITDIHAQNRIRGLILAEYELFEAEVAADAARVDGVMTQAAKLSPDDLTHDPKTGIISRR